MSRSDAHLRTRSVALPCPHCRGPLRLRSSEQVSDTLTTYRVMCWDPDCGATFAADFTLTHAISPSANPRAGVFLKTSAPRAATQALAVVPRPAAEPDLPVPANDDIHLDADEGGGERMTT